MEQQAKIDNTINVCRFVYNLALETKIRAWQAGKVNLSAFDLQSQLVQLKKDHSWLTIPDSQALSYSITSMDNAFKSFYKGQGFPKFKKKSKGGSYRNRGFPKKIDFDKCLLTIAKIPNIPIRITRRFDGEIRAITISKSNTGKYYSSMLVSTKDNEPKILQPKNAVGVDLGISHFVTLSTGEKINNPEHLRIAQKGLSVLQKRLSRKTKGGANRKKAIYKVSVMHERISNQRSDFLQKLSTRLICDNQTDSVCVENLAVSNMIKNRRLSKSISGASWGEFVRQLEYKSAWYGKNLIKIGRFEPSSKICSDCGCKTEDMNLSIRQWTCETCGAIHDRDVNAAINIKNIALRNSGRGTPGEPVESPSMEGAKKQED